MTALFTLVVGNQDNPTHWRSVRNHLKSLPRLFQRQLSVDNGPNPAVRDHLAGQLHRCSRNSGCAQYHGVPENYLGWVDSHASALYFAQKNQSPKLGQTPKS